MSAPLQAPPTQYMRDVLLARSLLSDFHRAASDLRAILDAGRDEEGMRVHLAEAWRLHEAVWDHLDLARAAADALGIVAWQFDELRAQRDPLASGVAYDGRQISLTRLQVQVGIDLASADLAGRCITSLVVTAPALPWAEEQRGLDALGAVNLLPSRGDRLVMRVFGAVATATLILVMLWLVGCAPGRVPMQPAESGTGIDSTQAEGLEPWWDAEIPERPRTLASDPARFDVPPCRVLPRASP